MIGDRRDGVLPTPCCLRERLLQGQAKLHYLSSGTEREQSLMPNPASKPTSSSNAPRRRAEVSENLPVDYRAKRF